MQPSCWEWAVKCSEKSWGVGVTAKFQCQHCNQPTASRGTTPFSSLSISFLIKATMTVDKEFFQVLAIPAQWFTGRESVCQYGRLGRHDFNPEVRKISWRRKWQSVPVYYPWKFHGQESLAGYCPGVSKSQLQLSIHATQASVTLYNPKGERTLPLPFFLSMFCFR